MSHPPDLLISDDDTSQVSTPILTQLPSTPVRPSSFSPEGSPSESTKSNSVLSGNSSHLRLPIPTPSANLSQTSFTFVDVNEDESGVDFDNLPAEVASADISIAPDGSFVETSSGQAARELKKRYDRLIKVDKDHRSPYAITAFVNQHGKQMYRVGHRDQSAPAADAEQRTTMQLEQSPPPPEAQVNQTRRKSSGTQPRSERHASRKSRMSMHTLLPGTMFPSVTTRSGDATANTRSPPARKLRKARSNPQMSADPAPQPHPPARGHSQSVTAADLPRLPVYPPPSEPVPALHIPPPVRDVFSDVMQWNLESGPPSPISSRSHSHSQGPEFVSGASPFNPFGRGVSYDSPTRSLDGHLHVPPLREMQSFESGLTARADGPLRVARPSSLALISALPVSESLGLEEALSFPPGLGSSENDDNEPSPSESEEQDAEPIIPSPPRSPSPSPSSLPSPSPSPSRSTHIDPAYVPAPETAVYTRNQTEIFDVLQTYRGLPVLERLLEDPADTVIRMSLTAEDSAAPRNDPRFVIWGTAAVESKADESQASRRGSGDVVQLRVTTEGPERSRVLVAATIERWLAQLTSALDYDELLVFFLTYRSYISPIELCQLLICRFHWALGRTAGGGDEMVRRIVRVRTFVAIRYWLLTFFAVDFVPDRELRLRLAGWLNTIRRDPILQQHTDAASIVRKLASVARDAKEAHCQRPRVSISRRGSGAGTPNGIPRKSSAANDEDLDLDFIPEPTTLLRSSGFGNVQGAPVGADGTAVTQQPLHRAILEHRPSLSASVSPTTILPPAHQNVLSRALASTVGRLGRWKRALNPRNGSDPMYADVSAFDLESNPEGDRLRVRGGVEQYLKMIEPTMVAALPAPPAPSIPPVAEPLSFDVSHPVPPPPPPPPPLPVVPVDASDPPEPESEIDALPSDETLAASEETAETGSEVDAAGASSPVKVTLRDDTSSRASTSSTSSSSSYGVPIAPRLPQQSAFRARRSIQAQSWQLDVVSIDDLDLSDTASDRSEAPAPPPGLKKLPRRLPLRRDFEFVDRNRESVSSMGFASQDESSASTSNSRRSSATSSAAGIGFGNIIPQWQMNALVDSLSEDEDEGDVEDALRRLEGQMNPQRQRAKETKVDNWVKTIRERVTAGDYGAEAPRYFSDDEEDLGDDVELHGDSAPQSAPLSALSSPSRPGSPASVRRITSLGLTTDSATPVPYATSNSMPNSSGTPRAAEDGKPVVEDAVPVEILRGRLAAPGVAPAAASSAPSPSQAPAGTRHRQHVDQKSWILHISTNKLAAHFTMIDRELFLAIKFEELVSHDWRGAEAAEASNVLDWAQFLKERARMKAQGVEGYRTGALIAARARFNLVTNFVITEIVESPPSERLILASKFIRIAWKCYQLNNYSTLVAIVLGLRHELVSRVMKRGWWDRVGVFDLRILKDLTAFIDAGQDFEHIRKAVAHLTDPKLTAAASEESTSVRSSTRGKLSDVKTAAGIPFLGIYLAPLMRVSKLPDLVDPTAPTEVVIVDHATNYMSPVTHPEVFEALPPLPPSMHLEPLINVHKQRLVARTVKSLVAGQHLASRLQLTVERRLFQRCLRLRGLDYPTLYRKLAVYTN
ncbi:hypothetical protein BC834DRAFT_950330 [Gloeopeniophorella convolvens]|nr:hypothetical protein BC834DRAFT_950330 [Gloeopeniophorella convolvens]